MRAADGLWVATPGGRLWAHRWLPAAAAGAVRAPLVLFHDSLGCVALWRDFPQQIAALAGGGATLVLLPGVGHVPHRERADEVLGRVAGWLAEIDG